MDHPSFYNRRPTPIQIALEGMSNDGSSSEPYARQWPMAPRGGTTAPPFWSIPNSQATSPQQLGRSLYVDTTVPTPRGPSKHPIWPETPRAVSSPKFWSTTETRQVLKELDVNTVPVPTRFSPSTSTFI